MAVLTSFQNHSEPIISTLTMKEFIEQAPAIFGDVWKLLCDLRGVKENIAQEKGQTQGKKNEVFFELLALARVANHRKLTHWTMIQNIASFARGVGRSTEAAFAYFGHLLSSTSRDRIFGKLTGNNAKGEASDNTLRH